MSSPHETAIRLFQEVCEAGGVLRSETEGRAKMENEKWEMINEKSSC